MASVSSKFIESILKSKKKKDRKIRNNSTTFESYAYKKRALEDMKQPPKKLEAHFAITTDLSLNHPIYYLMNKNGKSKSIMIYLHGGAYIHGPMGLQWDTFSEISLAIGADLIVLDYPFAPEYRCTQILAYTIKAYKKIVSEYETEHIYLIGDSAGGGLSLSLYAALEDEAAQGEHIKYPQKMVLLSPWLDVSMSHELIPDYTQSEALLSLNMLIECGLIYAGELDSKDSRVSPQFETFSTLPETHIFVGTREVLYPDCSDFVSKAILAGQPVTLHAYSDMQHVWPIIPFIEEGKRAREEIMALLSL
ncbi:MAG: alpha/beta hydrolase [Vallitaleaceae bacterium]|jgi:monoterpene epsilon-lactone hydrolase|nr:alpha/beta hydrolase [Vallitaleaceae bacterium]